ncbi:haloacid dehalogenase superfamily, subfamily IA, variant 3 with third motif having DD or ED/haloacid dehalogenase superfamily, subfamily IA, variant 1 with third motif having Dx(3-4)D or Dx(3-4)E [Paraburkholderia fungorum]|uniref:Haloacid dehalogenase superfamily, subfamily IA, variant 3 with third motif having DD or ED/haloacid dehalogenase superfamily, subfamily IA, variant 1 with third motif having Dx(3-4)D or Dx(3-4)E n=1 Tax=Paraburkholderia fungorum TaxID=134537 RepID=A0A1H1JVP1_9BURK|nr:HAD family hydrolase [Paraburkholderia fungorum]SDR54006.1 haloacid dehalogenase superfamily, subfamily IA, variant 3 with third motif having DD or ED/haloacid dehalogenase superfamily, subfamily IA, variant 1 with third motif having Dx(3-4)D or Dx(3-4)E [Paraburkholderia fungorum]
MFSAAVFDVDGTLIDSVDLHALAWHEAFAQFGHKVSFASARSQIGKGGDKLLPVFLSRAEIKDHGDALEQWRSKRFKDQYLNCVRPFSAVPDLFHWLQGRGTKIAVASSARRAELDIYLDIADIKNTVDVTVSSEDVSESKPAPDIFAAAVEKLMVSPREAIAIGDTPYDAQAAGGVGMATIGVLSGGFSETELRAAGCSAIYTSASGLLACANEAFSKPAAC